MNPEHGIEGAERLEFPTAEDMMPSQAFSVTGTEADRDDFDIDDIHTTSPSALINGFSTQQTSQNRGNRRLGNSLHLADNFHPPSPSDRWRSYLEAARGSSSVDNIETNTVETSSQLNRTESSSSFDYIQTDDGRISHVRINNPIPNSQVRQSLGIPRFLRGKVCDPSNFKNGERLLKFEVLLHDGSHISSLRGGVINILLKYAGYSETGCSSDTICSLSQVIFKSPERGYSWPSTRSFDSFTKELYEDYILNRETIDSLCPAGFFELNSINSQKDMIPLSDKPAKYVLVKLLTANCKGGVSGSSNVDLQYIGFVGRSGPRAIAAAAFC
ncbi:hypothetical protein BY458DRAFT_564343 [Sporodiniella umbellata]|nr:hypothetical protein BY458DRAFT_564343 [Sporodiniella umbellata]